MGVIYEMSKEVELPKMLKVKQFFNMESIPIENIPKVISQQLSQEKFKDTIAEDKKICITCGSRGISNIALITKSIVDYCKKVGAKPFVIPAMGSHGGATAESQKSLLEDYGVTEEYIGCPIYSSMETVNIGKNEEGVDVYIDKYAYESDGIIACGRVKPHTNFRGAFESGIMKMLAIGLGKQYGAAICHSQGFRMMEKNVLLFGRAIIEKAPVVCGLAIIENPYDATYDLIALSPEEIEKEEPKMLDIARDNIPKIYFDNLDLLIVDKIGKNYSGAGMDPNITGTFDDPEMTGGINSKRVVVLDLSEESHGNAAGISGADVTTQKLIDKYDKETVYINAITASIPRGAAIPMIAKNDCDCIKIAIKTTPLRNQGGKARIVRIANSMEIGEIFISEALIEEAKLNPNIEIVGELEEFIFNKQGNLPPFKFLE